ncbi:arylsulfatase [Purpureocillium lavendulum]|uniref:Arylsulfatase n=1 Tax=Purpureocillium lavendulum TaxID=1247861 RepID=A0AB34FEP3_9HYPO|nr:arylsulfatase [Purpureocillium lavendulum]
MTERRKRANSKANSEINNIGVESWMFELRKELAGARKDALEKLKALEAGPSPEQSSQADVVNGINELHRRLGGKKTVQRLTVFRKRYDRWHTAETLQGCYDAQSSPNTGQTLQAVEVAKAVLGDRISHMSDKQAQTKWKEESRKNKFWHRLVEEFGFAILQVLSPRLTDENARNLSNRDADAFILSLKEKWPSLREDTKGLSGMLSHFAKTGSLPEERLCLERARDGQIFINSRAQLLSYSNKCSCWNEAGGASPVVAQLVDPSSGAPASAPAPGGQTTSDADASATANVEENSMMPVISEDFGATNASAEADWAATFEGLSPLEIGSLADDDYNAWGFTGQEMPSMFDFSPTSEHRDEA